MARLKKISNAKNRVLLRRSLISEKYSEGHNTNTISKELSIPQATVSQDLRIMKRLAAHNIERFVTETLPYEMDALLLGSNKLLKKAFDVLDNPKVSDKTLFEAMTHILEIYRFRKEVLGDKLMMSTDGRYTPELEDMLHPDQRRAILQSPEQSMSEAIF